MAFVLRPHPSIVVHVGHGQHLAFNQNRQKKKWKKVQIEKKVFKKKKEEEEEDKEKDKEKLAIAASLKPVRTRFMVYGNIS